MSLTHLLICSSPSLALVIPRRFFFVDKGLEFIVSVNGSSRFGLCFDDTEDFASCNTPTTSVLFDGIPTLSGLDGNMWASPLFTLSGGEVALVFDFTMLPEYEGLTRIEVATFQCPEWGIGVSNIDMSVGNSIEGLDVDQSGEVNISLVSSCESLVRVCIDINRGNNEVVGIAFTPLEYAHLGEVTFINDVGTSCPPDIIIQPDDMTGKNK
jgi:hypothetical protein